MATILVLEDEPFIAMDLSFALEDAGHEAVTATSNDEASALLDDHDVAAAVLDVNLGPGMTCDPTADRLAREKIPFVLHTGDLDRVGERLRAFDAPVISKPRPAEDVIRELLALADQD